MKIDLHVHTAHSADATGTPVEVLAAARRAGLDGIAVTEHEAYEESRVFTALAPRYGLVVFAGAEVATRSGHLLVFSEDIGRWSRYGGIITEAQPLIDAVNAAGGAVVAAHPCRFGSLFGRLAVKRLRGLAAIEVCNGANGDGENEMARELAAIMGLPGTGGSDAHRVGEIGRCYTEFSVPVRHLRELVEALKSGRCAGASPGRDRSARDRVERLQPGR